MIWTNRFIPLPGQCFTVSRQRTLDGLEYEDLIEDCYLRPEYKEPQLHLDRDKAQSRLENDHCPNDPESKMGACATVQHDVVQRPQDPNPWRRLSVFVPVGFTLTLRQHRSQVYNPGHGLWLDLAHNDVRSGKQGLSRLVHEQCSGFLSHNRGSRGPGYR